MKLPVHMVCSCKFVRADVCVGRFVVNLSVNQRTNCKLDQRPWLFLQCSRYGYSFKISLRTKYDIAHGLVKISNLKFLKSIGRLHY